MEQVKQALIPRKVEKTLKGYRNRSKELKSGIQTAMKLIKPSIKVRNDLETIDRHHSHATQECQKLRRLMGAVGKSEDLDVIKALIKSQREALLALFQQLEKPTDVELLRKENEFLKLQVEALKVPMPVKLVAYRLTHCRASWNHLKRTESICKQRTWLFEMNYSRHISAMMRKMTHRPRMSLLNRFVCCV